MFDVTFLVLNLEHIYEADCISRTDPGGGVYSFIRFLLLRKRANPLALIDATDCQKELSDATVGNESVDVL